MKIKIKLKKQKKEYNKKIKILSYKNIIYARKKYYCYIKINQRLNKDKIILNYYCMK